MKSIIIAWLLLLNACTGTPSNITPVNHFNADKYLGKWYEIARLDHSFERGLTHVSATYTLREGGGINVLNQGFNPEKKQWEKANGKAYFVNSTDEGYLKVSFFGPFYGSYVVIDLDQENYQYSLVTSYNSNYLWILSRTPKMEESIKQRLIAKAKSLGFDTDKLIYVEQ